MTKTIENLTKAFIGESQARNRYDFYAKIAKKEGFEQIAAIFLITAENEKVHAKRLFEHIQELNKDQTGEIKVESGAATTYGNTVENLKAAIAGENYEHIQMYPEFAKIAEEEGLQDIANRLKAIAIAEKHHEDRFQKLLDKVESGAVFKKEQEVSWLCRECGYVHFGIEALEKCPSCDHPKSFYQVMCEEY
ncbi:MAG: ferritin family protein [Patescibacteria group bacterium]|nr:ferritin family protein [Patescibacteria group bacterium]